MLSFPQASFPPPRPANDHGGLVRWPADTLERPAPAPEAQRVLRPAALLELALPAILLALVLWASGLRLPA